MSEHKQKSPSFSARHTLSIFLLLLATSLIGCASTASVDKKGYGSAPQVINVSSYDPKERQREGISYSPDNLSALKRNGVLGLIARTSKGTVTDSKAARFLKAADREGMLLGAYHFVTTGTSAVRQADRFVERVRGIVSSKKIRAQKILLVGDFDSRTKVENMVAFLKRVEQRTGARPVVYLENADSLKLELRDAEAETKRFLQRFPYWLALYSHVDDGKSIFSADRPLTPEVLLKQYDVWDSWSLWQYGGVEWNRRRGRSVAKHYSYGKFRSPEYFGNLDRPMERNIFNGSVTELRAFWERNAWVWK